jgi:hypothetical protein
MSLWNRKEEGRKLIMNENERVKKSKTKGQAELRTESTGSVRDSLQ